MVIRLAGDSGDGIQLTGTEFTRAVALGGSDIATFPDIPAEIRAPAGSLAGVSGFQLQVSSQEIFTAGDSFFLPKGSTLTWVVYETMRKFYMTADT